MKEKKESGDTTDEDRKGRFFLKLVLTCTAASFLLGLALLAWMVSR